MPINRIKKKEEEPLGSQPAQWVMNELVRQHDEVAVWVVIEITEFNGEKVAILQSVVGMTGRSVQTVGANYMHCGFSPPPPPGEFVASNGAVKRKKPEPAAQPPPINTLVLPTDPSCKFCGNYPLFQCIPTDEVAYFWCAYCGALGEYQIELPPEEEANQTPVQYEERWIRPMLGPVELPN